MTTTFVPPGFEPPLRFETPDLVCEPLGPQHNARDHEAWMSSIEYIHTLPGFDDAEYSWPVPMTLEENLADLERHSREFEARAAFAYTVLDPEDGDVIGCLYIDPTSREGYDAIVRCWVCISHGHLDLILRSDLAGWLNRAWPFEAVMGPHLP